MRKEGFRLIILQTEETVREKGRESGKKHQGGLFCRWRREGRQGSE